MERRGRGGNGVRIIAFLLVLGALVTVVPQVVPVPEQLDLLLGPLARDTGGAIPGLAWSLVAVTAAILLLVGARVGWVLTMLVTGFGLAVDLVRWWNHVPSHITLALGVVTAFYLNSRSVRSAFLGEDPLAEHTIRPGEGDG
ncbi:MAG: hypothetical protein ACKOTZ_05650 [Chloroflexota bacterium]